MLADLSLRKQIFIQQKTLYTGLVNIVKLHAHACVCVCVCAWVCVYEKSLWEVVSRKNWRYKMEVLIILVPVGGVA